MTEKNLLFKGQDLQLMVTTTFCKPAIQLSADILRVNLYKNAGNPPCLNEILLQWYKTQSLQYLRQRTAFWAKKIGVSFCNLTIKDQHTRWGSCSSLHNLNFNWRIIMAPEPIIDYLVIHEVSHLVHLNHSAHFWQLVSHHDPKYQEHKHWLAQNGRRLFQILPKYSSRRRRSI